jgi:hypothetical protein
MIDGPTSVSLEIINLLDRKLSQFAFSQNQSADSIIFMNKNNQTFIGFHAKGTLCG